MSRNRLVGARTDTATKPDLLCPACLGPGRPLHLVVDGRFRLVRCRGCRTEYFRPDDRLTVPGQASTVSEYWESYKFDLYANRDVQREYEHRYDVAVAAAERGVGKLRSVLDVGCGIGNFVAFAKRRSLSAYGIDVDRGAVLEARSRGLDVRHSDELSAWLPDGSVDAVTLWDVIEHLYEPEPVLHEVLRKLRLGGAVLLETPDAAFPFRRVVLAAHRATRGRLALTSHLYYWEHKIYFTEAGLRAILARAGCEVVFVQHETSPRTKMQQLFSRRAEASLTVRVLATLWPLLERAARGLGRGNKLILVARRTTVSADGA